MIVITTSRFKLRNGKWVNSGKQLQLTNSYANELIEKDYAEPYEKKDYSAELIKGIPSDDESKGDSGDSKDEEN